MQLGMEETKLSLFVDDMILYLENPKKSTHTHIYPNICQNLKISSQSYRRQINIKKINCVLDTKILETHIPKINLRLFPQNSIENNKIFKNQFNQRGTKIFTLKTTEHC